MAKIRNSYGYRVIPIWNTTTMEEIGECIAAIEAVGFSWEYVHGKHGVHCIRYWDKNEDVTREVI